MVNVIHDQMRLICLMLVFSAALTSRGAEPDIRRDATVLAVDQVMPSVVNIATATVVEYEDFYQRLFREFYGTRTPARRQERLNSIGSGVIIDEEGYILTNLHVVRRASRTQVKLWDGREYEADRIVAAEQSDVALLKIRAKPGEKFRAVKLAPDHDLLLGETVLALGNPFGLGGTVTKGILSSKTRRQPTGDEPLNINDWLQTDAAINPGNSGGPLINLRGELIGLNVAIYPGGQGIGFAIPVKNVSEALAAFFSPEVIGSLWFGAQLQTTAVPLLVSAVQPGAPAEQAGLRAGDRILQVDGKALAGVIQFHRLLSEPPNHKVSLLVQQGKERRTIAVRLIPFDEMVRQKLGFAVTEVGPQEAARLGLQQGKGLFIEDVQKNSAAERAKLQRGLLLSEIDGHPADSLRAAAQVLASKTKGEQARLTIVAPRRIGTGFVEYREGMVDIQVQ